MTSDLSRPPGVRKGAVLISAHLNKVFHTSLLSDSWSKEPPQVRGSPGYQKVHICPENRASSAGRHGNPACLPRVNAHLTAKKSFGIPSLDGGGTGYCPLALYEPTQQNKQYFSSLCTCANGELEVQVLSHLVRSWHLNSSSLIDQQLLLTTESSPWSLFLISSFRMEDWANTAGHTATTCTIQRSAPDDSGFRVRLGPTN